MATLGQQNRTISSSHTGERHRSISAVQPLRHTFALTTGNSGAQSGTMRERLGHETPTATSEYLAGLRGARNPYASALADTFGVEEA